MYPLVPVATAAGTRRVSYIPQYQLLSYTPDIIIDIAARIFIFLWVGVHTHNVFKHLPCYLSYKPIRAIELTDKNTYQSFILDVIDIIS